MRIRYIVAILAIVLMIGCAAPQTTEPAAPAAEPPAAPAVEEPTTPTIPDASAEEMPTAEVPVEEAEISDADQAQVERLKDACEKGNAGLCAALKTRYNIEWPPAISEEPVGETIE
ncbi:MAG: hypothetical protein KKC75_00815 [Nanoarchaeota archaeon]|nr:hypothetical protein [Nanoarchaeota archaeon]MBU1005656.1 hypothetical protein [Nanoarchaeota archaeon]MBU1946919.1 hypothetical protein [Nanoarchaeota archaeon]